MIYVSEQNETNLCQSINVSVKLYKGIINLQIELKQTATRLTGPESLQHYLVNAYQFNSTQFINSFRDIGPISPHRNWELTIAVPLF